MKEGDMINIYAPITSLEIIEKSSSPGEKPKKTVMVKGYMTTDALDSHGDIIEEAASFKAADEWKKMGNIREMHQPSAVGVAVNMEKRKGKGVYLESEIVDPVAIDKVRAGVYKGYSIGGKINKIEIAVDEEGPNKITDYTINEVSLVDVPANPDCLFLAKRADFISAKEGVNKMAEPEKKPEGETEKPAEKSEGAESEEPKKDENATSPAKESQTENTSSEENGKTEDEAEKMAKENADLKKEIQKLRDEKAEMEKERTKENELVKLLTELQPDLKKRMSEPSKKKVDPKETLSKMSIGEITSLMFRGKMEE